MARPTIRKCYGRNPRTGQGVGERHSWEGGWGKGRCRFCYRYLEDLVEKPSAPATKDLPLDAAVERCVTPAVEPVPAHCTYPRCKCEPPKWCRDQAPVGKGERRVVMVPGARAGKTRKKGTKSR